MAGNPVKLLLSLYGTEWRERGYGLCTKTVYRSKRELKYLLSKYRRVWHLLNEQNRDRRKMFITRPNVAS